MVVTIPGVSWPSLWPDTSRRWRWYLVLLVALVVGLAGESQVVMEARGPWGLGA